MTFSVMSAYFRRAAFAQAVSPRLWWFVQT